MRRKAASAAEQTLLWICGLNCYRRLKKFCVKVSNDVGLSNMCYTDAR